MEYYIYNNNEAKGPFSVELLEKYRIPANTLVSSENGTEWVEASTVIELRGAIDDVATPTILTNQYDSQQQNSTTAFEPSPKNWLVESIISMLFCCLPFGLISLIYATKVDNLYAKRDYDGAKKASDSAKLWFNMSWVTGLIITIIYIIISTTVIVNDL